MESKQEFLFVNVRGFMFQVDGGTLARNITSRLYCLYKKTTSNKNAFSGPLYFNRDPFVFNSILDYYATGEFHLNGQCANKIRRELAFWGLSPEIMCLSCSKAYHEAIADTRDLQTLVHKWSAGDRSLKDGHSSCRERLWQFLEGESLSVCAKIYAAFVTVVNLVSVTVISISTTPKLRRLINSTNHSQFDSVVDLLNGSVVNEMVYFFDCAMIGVLLVDLILRFAAAPSKRKFFHSFINVVGVLSVVPALFIYLVVGLGQYAGISLRETLQDRYGYILLTLFILEGFRVIYVLRIARYYEPMKVIVLVMKESRSELFLLTSCLLMGATLFGHVVYAVEMYRDSFWSIPDAIWWAVITMTTVGYGDVVPVTAQGKVVGTICAISGILLLALPVPVIANNFIRFYNVAKLMKCSKRNSNDGRAH